MIKNSIKEKYDIQDYIQPKINIPNFKDKKGIILIVGSSGSGKSTILKHYGLEKDIAFDDTKKIIDNFTTTEEGESLLTTMGLRSIPTWFRSSSQVSNGEHHRAECALALNKGINCIDEFTSVVDRDTAFSLSVALRKGFNRLNVETLYIASCHRDIIEWLQPNYIYDTDKQIFINKELDRRPPIQLRIMGSTYKDWVYFKKHHYLDSTMNNAVHCYTAYFGKKKVGFLSIIHGCGRDIKSYWRECRLVVLPEFQGLGIGKRISEEIAEEYIKRGLRYFSKTAHPVLGEYRNNSGKWRSTSTNMKKRQGNIKKDGTARKSKGFGKTEKSIYRDASRLTYSHEYIGEHNDT